MGKSTRTEECERDLEDLAAAVYGMLVAGRDVLERAQRATLRLEQYRRSSGGAGPGCDGLKPSEPGACGPPNPDCSGETGKLPL